MSELAHQRKIIDDFKKAFPQAYGIKMSNRFLSGVPDLLLKAPGHDAMFVEVKLTEYKKRGYVNVDTTLLQRETMRNMERAGIRCEVWVVVVDVTGLYMLRTPPEATKVECTLDSLVKKERGQPWPLIEFVNNPVRRY